MNELKHYNIKIHGMVQGVFFRASARLHAEKLGIKGSVRNERDGSVVIEAEGDEPSLNEFVKWCHHGPESARVYKVDIQEGVVRNFTEFKITRRE